MILILVWILIILFYGYAEFNVSTLQGCGFLPRSWNLAQVISSYRAFFIWVINWMESIAYIFSVCYDG